MLAKHKTLKNLPNNLRFYVLASSILLSILVAAWLRLQIPSDQLFYIRVEQVYGFLSLGYLYIALITSPLSKILGKPRTSFLIFARRAVGVSAAYFACMHFAVAFWGQFDGFNSLGLLPSRFQWALLFGVFALVVLLFMAATSFDKVVSFMTLRRWKWLHRFVYAASILIILHVWMIGTHVTYKWFTITAFVALVTFFIMESYRTALNIGKKHKKFAADNYVIAITVGLSALLIALLLALPQLVGNHHSQSDHRPGTPAQDGNHE